MYLGDNARAPYGSRSYDIIYKFTKEAVEYLFSIDCNLVILACNTASAKALRIIQDELIERAIDKRVLGVIRPTVEVLGKISKTGNIGVLGTPGTISSNTYAQEIQHLYPKYRTYGQSCPMFVPLVEYGELEGEGTDYFVKKYIDNLMRQSQDIDTIILGCTHYPLLLKKIRQYTPNHVNLISQGPIVAESIRRYLIEHPEVESRIRSESEIKYLTTENEAKFNEMASVFIGQKINASQITLVQS